VDEDEALLGKELLEQRADTALDDEDGLVDLGSQIDGPVVQPGVETDKWSLVALVLLLLFFRCGQRPLGVFDLEWQRDIGLDLNEQLLDVDLVVLDRGTLDGFLDTLDKARHEKCALGADTAAVLDHLLAQLLASSNDSLHSVESLAQIEESELRRLDAGVLDPAPECDLLVLIVGSLGEVGAWGACRLELLRTAEWQLAVGPSGDIGGIISLLLAALGEFTRFGCSLLLCLLSCQ
jgi:hypothetical protein